MCVAGGGLHLYHDFVLAEPVGRWQEHVFSLGPVPSPWTVSAPVSEALPSALRLLQISEVMPKISRRSMGSMRSCALPSEGSRVGCSLWAQG